MRTQINQTRLYHFVFAVQFIIGFLIMRKVAFTLIYYM